MRHSAHLPRVRARMIIALVLAAVGSAIPLSLSAQVRPDTLAPDTVFTVEGVTVKGMRQATTSGGVAGIVTLPSALPIPPAASIEDALRKMPFILVRKNSRGMAEISVRGSESRQVAILLDGVPLTLAWDHRTDPAVLPVMGAQNITFVRGLPSILGGPNVLGGIVEVNLGRGSGNGGETDAIRAALGADDAGYKAASLSGVKTTHSGNGTFTMRAGAGLRSSDGVALSGDVNDPASEDNLRTNSDIEELNAFGALRWASNLGHWVSLSATGFTAERGVPPELHVQEPRLWRYPKQWQTVAALSAGTGPKSTPLGVGDLEASVGLNGGRQDIEAFETLDYDRVVETESGDDRTITARVLGNHSLTGDSKLRAAASYADVNHTETIDGTERNKYRQRLWSIGTELEWWLPASTNFSMGVALDGADTPETAGRTPLGTLSAWGARVGLSTNAVREDVQLHAAASTRARFPALRELYSGALGRFEPNPDLVPERLLAAEVGMTLKRRGIEIQTAVFRHELSDAVVRTTTPERMYRRINRDLITSTGVELFVGASISGAELHGDIMLQNVTVVDPAAGTGPIQPEHMPKFKAGLEVTAPVFLGITGLTSVRHTGDQYCVHPDLGTDIELNGKTGIDLGLRRNWHVGAGLWNAIRTTVSLDNIADAAVFDQCGMPQPGRTMRVGIEMF
jgi:iron complex outermembrane receptor protein